MFLDKIINKDNIKDNTVLVIKFANDGFEDFQKVANQYQILFEGKKGCNIVFMHQDQDLVVLPEKEMNSLGWFKR